MRRTLLELTQDILSAIDGDQVNSISDTVESLQVVNLLKQTYYDILDERELTYVGNLTTLTGLGDTDKPNYMGIPEEFIKIEWVRYDCRPDVAGPKDYRDVDWLEPREFVVRVNQRDSTQTDRYVVVNHASGIPLIIDKTVAPRYWTSFNDQEVIFDSYDEDVDSTLQSSKCQIYAYSARQFTVDDAYIPDLPVGLFQYLYHQAEATAHAVMRQMISPKSEQQEMRARNRSNRTDWITNRHEVEGPDYGKRSTPRKTFRRRGP
jgi:hypothetical protein